MKKVISILLTLLIFLNSSNYILIYVERLATNKQEMLALIRAQQKSLKIQELKFSKYEYMKKLNWKDEKEFEYNGRMYDVASIRINKDNITICCVRDENEEMLISNFEKMHRRNSAKDRIASDSRTSLLAYHLLATQNKINSEKRATNVSPFLVGDNINYNSIYIKAPTPPPKIV